VFINFWYPVVRSQDLRAAPHGVRILGHDFVAFRDHHGQPAVLADTCVHRGASLSRGRCKPDGTVQCPYHGWRYDVRGQCTRIPSLGIDAKIPPRARVDSYPVEERYGIVFAFLGDLPAGERPPIMPVAEHGMPEWRATVAVFDVAYHYERSIENGLDPAHNEYVHPTHGYQGERESEYRVNELRPHLDNPWGFGFMHTFDAPPLRKSVLRFARRHGGKMDAGSGTFGPNQMWTFIHFSPTAQMHQYMFEAPIDETRTRIFLLTQRNQRFFFRKGPLTLLNGWLDGKVDERNRAVAAQDIEVVRHVRPVITPPGTSKELLMPHDRVIVQYREKLREFEQRGWRIDSAALREARERGNVVFAIPCPARRETRTWVLDAVPLVAGTAAGAGSAGHRLQATAGEER
jgi:phenylpropionate dioxygenase-like ring-hydroxylating dioxygenase large terminal subunit